ncbi:ABC transporter substrate-binding protein [Schaalia naturae]|jgi:alpha-glucoside transport system substrate-binding protein|uniref:ABC transporter substrate-binding protein n=1 Tax=Schaalia naturae TaxID=635203 RepID=A0ABW2SPG0_9ACTO
MLHHHSRRPLIGLALAAALGLTGLTACSSGSQSGSSSSADCSAYESYGDLSGSSVSIYSPYTGADQERLENSWADFSTCTGVEIVYEGSSDFESQVQVRIQGGNLPDILFVAQPGLLTSLADEDLLVPATDTVQQNVETGWSDGFRTYGSVDGTLYASPLTTGLKSFVWYSPKAFAEKGYEVPTTWQELLDLTDTISKTGDRVWCEGFESGAATGWPGTDWLEDLVIRSAGADVYDQWISHEIPFNDPQIVNALDEVGKILKNDAYVNAGFGDVSSIASTNQLDALYAIGDGSCYLSHRNGSATWDEEYDVAPDGDVWGFAMPVMDEGDTQTLVGGGEFVAALSDDPAVTAVREYFSSATFANDMVKQGLVSANQGVDPANATSEQLENVITILQDKDAEFRFDASDLMPTAVGSGTFWTGMVDWILGADSQDVLDQIEASWPEN